MREFNLVEYQKLLKSDVSYIVKVDPMITDVSGDHELHLHLASDRASIDSFENIFGSHTIAYHISSSDDILIEMANGVYGLKFLIV